MTFEPRPARFGAQGYGGGAPMMARSSPKSNFYSLIMPYQLFQAVWEPTPLGGGRTGHGCGRQPPKLLADKAALAARQGLWGLPTAPILGGAEGGFWHGCAKKAYHGEGSGVESPRGKRQPTKKDLTTFRGGGRGRGLLCRFCPLGLYRHNKPLSGGDCARYSPIVWEPTPLGGGRTGHGCRRQPPKFLADKAALAARQGLWGLPTAPILGGAVGGFGHGCAKKTFVPPNYGGEGG